MKVYDDDTIVALATPAGPSGLAVIRLSGSNALSIAARGFRGKGDLTSTAGYTAHVGTFVDPGERKLDEVVALVFRGPRSYTGEDAVELTCHGGVYVTREIILALLKYGARHARAGEFTQRAFLNGRIDLSQAEAVADLISAESRLAHQSSLEQLQGILSGRVKALRDRLVQTMGLMELELDFAEDGYELVDKTQASVLIRECLADIRRLTESFEVGRLLRDGVKVVLTGSPNAGKSSLLNRLLQQERAIVTEVPGTTRDTLEENIHLEGLTFRLVDTAGIRSTSDAVEIEGVRRAEAQVRDADVVVIIFDRSRAVEPGDIDLAKRVLGELKRPEATVVVVFNKTDLPDRLSGTLKERGRIVEDFPRVALSCVSAEGIDEFKSVLLQLVGKGTIRKAEEGIVVTNLRHRDALSAAAGSLGLALESIEQKRSGELVAVDLRRTLRSLGEIIGEVTTEDILTSIFSKFCIGK